MKKKISFDKLLLKTAICCMTSDGQIDEQEMELIRSLCIKSPLFIYFDFEEAIDQNIVMINANSKEYINEYFEQLANANLSEQQELTLIDFAIRTINANNVVEDAEIKFFKSIRERLAISNENILKANPDLQMFLK